MEASTKGTGTLHLWLDDLFDCLNVYIINWNSRDTAYYQDINRMNKDKNNKELCRLLTQQARMIVVRWMKVK